MRNTSRMARKKLFILSPARTGGKRASMVLNEKAEFDLARRLREPGGAAIGDLFSFMSGLYFRGKLAYASHFAEPPELLAGAYVITSSAGLVSTNERLGVAALRAFVNVPIDPSDR